MMRQLESIRDRLNAADARLGDGDTGMTVARIVAALHRVSGDLPADIGESLAIWSRECAKASGSSLGAVIAIGLSRAAKAARGRDALDRAGLAAILQQTAEAIIERTGATPGDKTILDSVLRVQAALADEGETGSMAQPAVIALDAALEDFRPRRSGLGRARMYEEKSIGLDDPGMLAACLLVHAALEEDQNSPPPVEISSGVKKNR